jgi:hypothetical protein
MSELQDLEQRLTSLINNQCNTIGCDNCGLKFGGFDSDECSATDLQSRIMKIEMEEFESSQGATNEQ